MKKIMKTHQVEYESKQNSPFGSVDTQYSIDDKYIYKTVENVETCMGNKNEDLNIHYGYELQTCIDLFYIQKYWQINNIRHSKKMWHTNIVECVSRWYSCIIYPFRGQSSG